jgi:hypothetical protein
MARKTFSKKERLNILNKYNGHCAYCGKPINVSTMQVDHLIPVRKEGSGCGELPSYIIHTEENYMPACRRCNHYKRSNSLETFRKYISEIPRKIAEDYIAKVGIDYGIIILNAHTIKFYFEMTPEERLQRDIKGDYYEKTCFNPEN